MVFWPCFLLLTSSPSGGADPARRYSWLCGYVLERTVMLLRHNFYRRIKRYFRWLGGMPKREKSKEWILFLTLHVAR